MLMGFVSFAILYAEKIIFTMNKIITVFKFRTTCKAYSDKYICICIFK
jgi:hypothetical protein